MKTGSLLRHPRLMRRSRIVEGGMAVDSKLHTPLRYADTADELMVPWRVRRQARWHKIQNLGDTVRYMEARYQHVGIRPVKLLRRDVRVDGGDLEPAALFIVENGRKHAGRIEMRKA